MEPPQKQILVVVASIQVRTLKTEVWRRVPCEQQLIMGQSVLRDRLTPLSNGVLLTLVYRKGIRLIFLNISWRSASQGVVFGNENFLSDGGSGPGKSYLFFIRYRIPWNRVDLRYGC